MKSTLSSFDKGNAVCAVVLDLSKAFDFVDRKFLLDKLKYYEQGEKCFNILENVCNINVSKKNVKNIFQYELGVFIYNFKKGILPVNLGLSLKQGVLSFFSNGPL